MTTAEEATPRRLDRREMPGAELACAITMIKDAKAGAWNWTVKVGHREQWGSTPGARADAWKECRMIAERFWEVR